MQLKNKVVVRFRNGKTMKGYTLDFTPGKEMFHLAEPGEEEKVTEIRTDDLKAVFYVKTFDGNAARSEKDFTKESLNGVPGLKLKVTFGDGEVMYGTTNGYDSGRKGFFLLPVDKSSNNLRVYVLADSTKSVDRIGVKSG